MKTMGSTQEVADHLGVSAERVRQLCKAGRVMGAERVGRDWVIPWPPVVLDVSPSNRRPGKFERDRLPPFLKKRLPADYGIITDALGPRNQ